MKGCYPFVRGSFFFEGGGFFQRVPILLLEVPTVSFLFRGFSLRAPIPFVSKFGFVKQAVGKVPLKGFVS